MKVYALVGKSGTGKSYRALTLSHEKNIESIIDDGLLIKGNRILGGKSAKRQATSVTAVKTALFLDEDHRNEVANKIKESNLKSILVLGTSDRMVQKISKAIGLDEIDEYIYIDEIATKEEQEVAKKQRHIHGKHVIPVPTFEIKRDFSGYFIDKLKIFKKRKDNTMEISEKSIVRPTFSYRGKYTIAKKVIIDLVSHVISDKKEIEKVYKINTETTKSGIIIDIDLSVYFGNSIKILMKNLQRHIINEVETMTALNITAVNINVKGIKIKK
ncbi:Asp23/Gls24 family envelope stress response protein [Anaeromicrobium sediminis]|uniref:Asp23/Gls24 family envelope stress response protein n=1 Tax=Anaeromicrobium sediminis TaxID=1478221 RepID=A0A267MID0_9FIRM|nr:Asp23/Gls24 family envelope stress response protein [Anaeromicrobium sediminis]PAB59329.1 hypothetical protein CCE28_10735 [Anaeromicrobium sediminis]